MGIFEFLRQFRIGEYAIFDFAASFLVMYFMAPVLTKAVRHFGVDVPKWTWMYFTIPLSVLAHLLVGTITPLTQHVIDPHGSYVIKALILLLIILGAKDVRIIKK